MDLKQSVLDLSKEIHTDLIGVREHLHAHPELSNEETQTADYIVQQLQTLGVTDIQTGVAGTGVVATIKGEAAGSRVVGLRPDMDALPITEANDVAYKSTNEGVMHACGHDVHMTCSLGAARILSSLKAHWGGSVRLFFQPSEEKLPGGAQGLIDAGVIDDPKLDALFALHVLPEMAAGTVGFRGGEYMASADEIYITINGKGGHAALAGTTIDPIRIAANVINELHTAVELAKPSDVNTVFALGRIEGLGATNIIPNQVTMAGTFRTMNESWREEAKALIRDRVEKVAASFGGSAEVDIIPGTPVLSNNEELTAASQAAATNLLGAEHVEDLPLRMSSDDFAFYTDRVPCCYFRLGVGNKAEGITSMVHTDTFDIDPAALRVGAATLAWLVLAKLS